jgi:hydroxyacylglutathione hydrolase
MQICDNLHAFMWRSPDSNNCNTYFIDGPSRILIDPGHQHLLAHVEKHLDRLNLGIGDMDLVIVTHAHPDHMEAVPSFQEASTRMALHRDEWRWVKSLEPYLDAALGVRLEALRPDFLLVEGDLNVKGIELRILHTPGHSPGSVSIYWPRQQALFSGDLIFKAGLGRTDLPGGDPDQLKASISRLAALDIEYLLPGHGETVIGAEAVQSNFDAVRQTWFDYI